MARDDSLRSVREAAAVLGVSPHTVRHWVRDRRLPHRRLGRRILFSTDDLGRVIRAARVPAKTPAVR
jgi:excisionase family DNA binding protein